jgi:hypothetical protein
MIIGLLCGCLAASCASEDDPWWMAQSPGEDYFAGVSMRKGRIGGDTTTVSLFEIEDGWKIDWSSRVDLFRIHGCSVLYVFWEDHETLEVVLDPIDNDCEGRAPLLHRSHGRITIEITRPASTSKTHVFSADPFELPEPLKD